MTGVVGVVTPLYFTQTNHYLRQKQQNVEAGEIAYSVVNVSVNKLPAQWEEGVWCQSLHAGSWFCEGDGWWYLFLG